MTHSLCVKIEGDGNAVRLGASGLFATEGVKGARTGGETAEADEVALEIVMMLSELNHYEIETSHFQECSDIAKSCQDRRRMGANKVMSKLTISMTRIL